MTTRFLACTFAAFTTLALAACTEGGTPGTADGGDAGIPASDAGASLLGFHASNLDHSPQLEATLADATLGDIVLEDCGPQIESSENGHVGCDGAVGEKYKQIDGFGGTQKYAVFVAKNIRIPADKIVAVGGDRPLILVALETITIDGAIEVSEGKVGAPVDSTTKDGTGPGGGIGLSNSTGGAGGGGSFCGKGGMGGIAAAAGGASYGNAEIVPLQGGSNGGGYLGARGGGAIQLVAGRSIVLGRNAYINAHGDGAVSGGGSGGAILLEAPTVHIEGSLTANGGGGGAPGGASGTPGNRTSSPALGGRNTENINGGDGSAGTAVNGTNGVLNPNPPNDGSGSGSGGGGAGWIRINTRSGAAEMSGLVSPALGSTCATQGTLR
ncbi:MAG: Glycine-rich cell wall structural protein [Myxococcaceae bacterium]|nr:Glycine-rich cell wall structural protein [Myxococcaceae bacterium]